MIQRAWKTGNSFVVTIPRAEIERQGIVDGELTEVTVHKVEIRRALTPTMQGALDEALAEDQEALRYPADK
jgi:antitoxin component of MazEF toxin-antitoxin module